MENDNNIKFGKKIIHSISDSNLSEFGSEILEFGIDDFLSDGELLKEIPVAGWLFKASKAYNTISDKLFISKIIRFMANINISDQERVKFKKEIEDDPKLGKRLGSKILFILNSFNDNKKSEILAKVFTAYLKDEITYDQLFLLSDSIHNTFISDLIMLQKEGYIEDVILKRLNSSHLSDISLLDESLAFEDTSLTYYLSELGEILKAILQNKMKERILSIKESEKLAIKMSKEI